MRLQIVAFRITADYGSDWRLSTEDSNGEPLASGDFRLTDPEDDEVIVTEPVVVAVLRAIEAAKTGVILD